MSRYITYRLEARIEFDNAMAFYESQRVGLGRRFIGEIDASIQKLNQTRSPMRLRREIFDGPSWTHSRTAFTTACMTTAS